MTMSLEELGVPINIIKLLVSHNEDDNSVGLEIIKEKYPIVIEKLIENKDIIFYHQNFKNDKNRLTESSIKVGQRNIVLGSVAIWI